MTDSIVVPARPAWAKSRTEDAGSICYEAQFGEVYLWRRDHFDLDKLTAEEGATEVCVGDERHSLEVAVELARSLTRAIEAAQAE